MVRRLTVDLIYDADTMHGDDPASIAWFDDHVLGGELVLLSTEIGDEVGMVKVVQEGDLARRYERVRRDDGRDDRR